MAKWSARSGLYQACLVLTYVVFLMYALAFAIPSWIGIDTLPAGTNAGKTQFQGLWMLCYGSDQIDFDDCNEHSFGDDWDWMDGVRGCWTGGMFFFLVGVLYSMIENCCGDEDSKDYGLTGTLVLLSGLSGAAGVILTAIKMENSDSTGYSDYYWGYMLACIASGLAILLAIVLLIARNSGRAYDDDDYDNKHQPGSRAIDYINNYGKPQHHYPSPYEYHNAGYRGEAGPPYNQHESYGPPLGNGVSYHHQASGQTQQPYSMYHGNQPHSSGGYYPSGPGVRHSMAESADLSNGFTPTILQAEHSLQRPGRGDYYLNGSRPY